MNQSATGREFFCSCSVITKAEFCVCEGKAGICKEKGWLLAYGKDASFPASGVGTCFLPSEKESSQG